MRGDAQSKPRRMTFDAERTKSPEAVDHSTAAGEDEGE
jgi:hypothetical protein